MDNQQCFNNHGQQTCAVCDKISIPYASSFLAHAVGNSSFTISYADFGMERHHPRAWHTTASIAVGYDWIAFWRRSGRRERSITVHLGTRSPDAEGTFVQTNLASDAAALQAPTGAESNEYTKSVVAYLCMTQCAQVPAK